MTVYLASDHAGFDLKAALMAFLTEKGIDVTDVGPHDKTSVDYPDYGAALSAAMKEDDTASGIAICGSGIGISIAVNRYPWMRAALVSDVTAARLCREHNNANVLALGERLVGGAGVRVLVVADVVAGGVGGGVWDGPRFPPSC